MSIYDQLAKLDKLSPTLKNVARDPGKQAKKTTPKGAQVHTSTGVHTHALDKPRDKSRNVSGDSSRKLPAGNEGKEEQTPAQHSTQKITQHSTHKVTHLLKTLSIDLSTEEIESLSFELRKDAKVRINADVPIGWKDLLDNLAHQLKVGKYELLLYMIAVSLGKVPRAETT